MTHRVSWRALTCTLFLSTTALALPAYAQLPQSPTFRQIDDNGVDLVQGDLISSLTEGSIGSGAAALVLNRRFGNLQGINSGGTTQWDRTVLQYIPGNGTFVEFGERDDKFPGAETRGATLTGSGGSYQYTAPDGTAVAFTNNEPPDVGGGDTSNLCRTGSTAYCILVPTSITTPNGNVTTLEYGFWTHCFTQTPQNQLPSPDDPVHCDFVPRLKKVTNSFGYAIAFTYVNNQTGGAGSPPANWYQRTLAQLFNNAVSTTVPQASVSYAYPSAGVTDVTDIGGRVWRITDNGTTLAIRRPGAAADTTSYSLSSGKVTSVTNEGVTATYSRAVVGSTITMMVTDALAKQTVVTSSATIGRPTSVKDPLNRTTSFTYDASNRLQRVTLPEGNYVQYGYDTRGNITSTTQVAKSGSGLPNIVTSATFPSTCANVKTCNHPATTTDARGKVTDYTYDSTHGGVLTVTAPAPATGAVRPKTTYSYAQFSGVYLPTGTSTCQTLASCANGADEARTGIGYDARGNVTSYTGRNGTGTLSVTSTATYDGMGNMLTVDGPLAGTADTTRYRYNTARDVIGTVSPDPDGAGTLKNRAVRSTYTNGLMTRQELGTVNSQSDSDWTAFAAAETVDITYDASARVRTQKLSGSGGAVALTQFSYDALGRSDCVATRMNPAIYASLPASACTLGTAGSNGPDRIGQTLYDFAGQVTQNKVAVGTADAATERTLTYTSNGKLATLKDAESNLTTYEYDGHDRLVKTRFPSPTKGVGTSSTTDYEQLIYENTASGTRTSGTVATFRNRANETANFTYDNLSRLTLKDLPGTEPDVTYGYDNLNRLTSASQTGHALGFTYDALSRQLTETNPLATVTRSYDAAGRLSAVIASSGYSLSYQRLVTGELTGILDGAGGSLATLGYDNLGRRTSLTFGNGSSTAYAYDPVSRLTTLTNDLPGTANDLTIGSIAYNPSSQIVSQNRSNDLYAWTGHSSGSTASVANGLNQLTSIGGSATAHDAKGNLTSDPVTGKTYTYSSENLLISASGGGTSATLTYDPLGRLYQVTSGTTTRRFLYGPNPSNDGLPQVLTEYDGAGTVLNQYGYGPGTDEPLLWWDMPAGGLLKLFHADERGSIVAVTDATPALVGINTYDEYGKPGPSNIGRFQYTGQMWLGEIGLQYSKARMYDPRSGRFLQTDPIGYEAGTNLYAYVGNNPVNFVDPGGMEEEIVVTGRRPDQWDPWGGNWFFGNSGSGGSGVDRGGEGGDGGEIVVTGKRRPAKPAVLLPGPFNDPNVTCDPAGCDAGVVITARRKPAQCQPASGVIGDYEKNLGNVSDALDVAAGIAAFTGAEPLAFALKGTSLVLTGLKVYSQRSRGDIVGSNVTLGIAGGSKAFGLLRKLLPIGGAGQERFNEGVGDALGFVYGKGIDKALGCE